MIRCSDSSGYAPKPAYKLYIVRVTNDLQVSGTQTSLRELNAARLVECVKRYGQITQVELAAATGLSPATVSNIVKQLVSLEVLNTQNTTRSGRRAQLVSLQRKTGLAAGLQVDHRELRLELADSGGEIDITQRLPLPENHRVDTTLDRAALLVLEACESLGASVEEMAALTMSLPAPVDQANGRILDIGTMPGWAQVDVADVMSRRLGVEVTILNDAHAGALGEIRMGNLRGVQEGIYLHCSRFTGAALIIGGQLPVTGRASAGEIGHVQVDSQGMICHCGARGCLNTVVGSEAIVQMLRLSKGSITLRDVIKQAQAGDPGCCQAIIDAGAQIGKVVADLAIILGSTHIVVGGTLAEAGAVLLDPLADAVKSRPLLGNQVQVQPALLGLKAEVKGALSHALQALDPVMSPEEEKTRE